MGSISPSDSLLHTSYQLTPAPSPSGPVFLHSDPLFSCFQVIVPIFSMIFAVGVVIFIVKRRMFTNMWHKLVFINRLSACSFALARFGMLVFIQLVRHNMIASSEAVEYRIVHNTCSVFKAIEVAGIYLTLATNCVLFYCLFLMQKTYQEFLLTGSNAEGVKGSVYLFLGWITIVELILATMTLLNGDKFVVSDSYCLMVSETWKHMNIFRICGSIGFMFPYALGWVQAIRLFCSRRFQSIHAAFWPIRRMLFWLSITFFITNGWLVANVALLGYYNESKSETDRYILAVLISGLQNVIEAVIIIYLVMDDIKRRRSFGTEFTEPFQTPCLINKRLVIGRTKSAKTTQAVRPSVERDRSQWAPVFSSKNQRLQNSPQLP